MPARHGDSEKKKDGEKQINMQLIVTEAASPSHHCFAPAPVWMPHKDIIPLMWGICNAAFVGSRSAGVSLHSEKSLPASRYPSPTSMPGRPQHKWSRTRAEACSSGTAAGVFVCVCTCFVRVCVCNSVTLFVSRLIVTVNSSLFVLPQATVLCFYRPESAHYCSNPNLHCIQITSTFHISTNILKVIFTALLASIGAFYWVFADIYILYRLCVTSKPKLLI